MRHVEKLKYQLKNGKALIADTLATLKEINVLMRSLDPLYVRMAWIKSLWDAIYTIGVWAVIGVGFQHIADILGGQQASFGSIVLLTIIIVGALFVSNAGDIVVTWRKSMFDRTLADELNSRIVDKLARLDLGRLSDPTFLELKDNAHSRGVDAVSDLWEIQMKVFRAVAGVVISLGVLSYLNPWLCLFAALPVLPQAYQSLVVQNKRRELHERQHLARRRRNEYESMLTGRYKLVQTKLFRFVTHMRERYVQQVATQREEHFELGRYTMKTNMAMEILQSVVLAACLLYLGKGILDGTLTIAKIFVFFGGLRSFTRSLYDFANESFVELHTKYRDYRYLEDLFETQPLISEIDARDITRIDAPVIECEDITFSYPSRKGKLALNNLSLQINPGEKVAIVGKNGSGKTTLARLIAKVYLPNSGCVRLDGISTEFITQESWLKHLLYVMQSTRLPRFDVTFALTGSSNGSVDMNNLIRAAEMSDAHSFIKNLPSGYGTQIGEEWPSGVDFSSGQEQRLFLAGAFYRLMNPDVHVAIFDEPMAHCDTETRTRFYSSLLKFKSKTIIVIAHDPLYLHYFDRVIVLENGLLAHDIRGPGNIESYRAEITHQLAEDL